MIKIEIGKNKKRKLEFSKKITLLFLFTSTIVTLVTLYICYQCIQLSYEGSLPFLTTLIGLQEFSLGFVCSKYMDKSKAENTAGGIIHDQAVTYVSGK